MGQKVYEFNGLAGCVAQAKARQTGTLVGIYHAEQAGLVSDPEFPWAVACEVHNNLISCATLKMAKGHSTDPKGWCAACDERDEEES